MNIIRIRLELLLLLKIVGHLLWEGVCMSVLPVKNIINDIILVGIGTVPNVRIPKKCNGLKNDRNN